MWSEGNHIYFVGKTGEDFLPTSAALHNLIHKQGYQDVILDFSKVSFFDPSFMIPLVATARAYRGERVDFELRLPDDKKASNLLMNANWAHLIAPEKYDPKDDQNKDHLSAIQYMNSAEHFAAVDRSMSIILQRSNGLDRSRLKALEWSLNEITDNVLNHSESPFGGIVQVMTFANKQRVEFYVCDAGVGIPRSLRNGRPDIGDDVSALRAAIEEGVTKNKSTNQGNGLFGTFKCCEVSGGEFDILSGNVSLKHRPGEIKVSRNNVPFKGTFVRAAINYDFEKLLEKALIFRGKAHDPAGDYIERVYIAAGDEIEFAVARELDSFGSRDAGRFARNKLENLMDNRSVSISLNFDGVHLISSSFADEVFGKLFLELGPIAFGQLCKFRNVDPTVQKLIDRAIAQRMRQ